MVCGPLSPEALAWEPDLTMSRCVGTEPGGAGVGDVCSGV